MGNLNQNARAVAGFRIAAAGTAVGQINQYLDALENDLVALLPPNVRHKPHAASVMLMGRVIHPLGGGQAIRGLEERHRGRLRTTSSAT